MQPFYTDYQNDYPDDWDSGGRPTEEPDGDCATRIVVAAAEGILGVIVDICDAAGLMPGSRWPDGGP